MRKTDPFSISYHISLSFDYSGLLNYLFGVDRKKEVTKEQFKKLQTGKLNIDDVVGVSC